MNAVPAELDVSLLDAEGQFVSGDALCRTCEYNLRTLALTAVCPECGNPVADSLRREGLEYADIRWLRRLRLGTRLMMVASIGFMLGFAFILLINLAFTWPGAYAWIEVYYMFVGLCWLAGVCWGLVRESGSRFSALQSATRWIARISALVLIADWSLVLLNKVSDMPLDLPQWVAITAMISLYFLPFVSPMMVCLHYMPIAARDRRKRLRLLNLAIVGLLGFIVLFFAAAIILSLTRPQNTDPGFILLVVMAVLLAAFAVGIFGFAGHLRMLKRAIVEQRGKSGGFVPHL